MDMTEMLKCSAASRPQVYPACYLNMDTPQRTLVPGGAVGGGITTVDF